MQFFGLSRGVPPLRRAVGRPRRGVARAGRPARAGLRAARSGRSCRPPGLPPGRPRGPLRRRRGLAPGRCAAGTAALPRGRARRGGHGGGPVVVPPAGRPRPPRGSRPLGHGRPLADRAPGPPRGVPAGHRARRAHGERGRSRGGRARAAGDGRGRRAAGPHRRVRRPVAPASRGTAPAPPGIGLGTHDRAGRAGQLGRPDARRRRHARRLAQRRAPRRPGARPAGRVRAGLAACPRPPRPSSAHVSRRPACSRPWTRPWWSTTRRPRSRWATGRTRSPCAASGPPTRAPAAPRCGAWTCELRPGRRVALVGPSGAGKSTLADVLVRFLPADAGEVTLDGVSLERLAADDVRRVVGLVEQSPHLFDTTLAENLRVGRRSATDAELEDVLARVGLGPWLAGLPDGLAHPGGPAGRTPVGRTTPAGRRRPRPAGRLPHPGARRAGRAPRSPRRRRADRRPARPHRRPLHPAHHPPA